MRNIYISYVILNNKEIIEECINDIFLSVWNNSEKFSGENSNHYVNDQSNTYYCDMIGKIDEKATKLIITPVIELCDEIIFDEKGFPIGKIDISSENNVKINTIVFKNDLIIDLK